MKSKQFLFFPIKNPQIESMREDFMMFLPPQQEQDQQQDDAIDERIDVHDLYLQKQLAQPLQRPDSLKYYYMTQLLCARNSPPGNTKGWYFEDWMFKEQVVAAAASQEKDN